MGIDITAYSKLEYVSRHEALDLSEMEEDGGTNCRWTKDGDRLHIQAFAYDSFPHALEGLPEGEVRKDGLFGADNFISAGCFALTPETQTHEFAAGSYSGYSRWRDELGKCFNWTRDTEDPFFELIYFADNEGTLLAHAAGELFKDFEAGAHQWAEHCGRMEQPGYTDWYRRKYTDWWTACELAADGGLIDFH